MNDVLALAITVASAAVVWAMIGVEGEDWF